jgi:hypothetical protein
MPISSKSSSRSLFLLRYLSPALGLEGDMILKLFDRLVTTQIREDEGFIPRPQTQRRSNINSSLMAVLCIRVCYSAERR